MVWQIFFGGVFDLQGWVALPVPVTDYKDNKNSPSTGCGKKGWLKISDKNKWESFLLK